MTPRPAKQIISVTVEWERNGPEFQHVVFANKYTGGGWDPDKYEVVGIPQINDAQRLFIDTIAATTLYSFKCLDRVVSFTSGGAPTVNTIADGLKNALVSSGVAADWDLDGFQYVFAPNVILGPEWHKKTFIPLTNNLHFEPRLMQSEVTAAGGVGPGRSLTAEIAFAYKLPGALDIRTHDQNASFASKQRRYTFLVVRTG